MHKHQHAQTQKEEKEEIQPYWTVNTPHPSSMVFLQTYPPCNDQHDMAIILWYVCPLAREVLERGGGGAGTPLLLGCPAQKGKNSSFSAKGGEIFCILQSIPAYL